MSYCGKCGKDLGEGGAAYCPACGAPQAAAPGPAAGGDITEGEWRAYLGDNADRYLQQFRRFTLGGAESFTVTWHWPAFLAGFTGLTAFWWFLYRKLYAWAAAALVSALIPYVNLLGWVAWPMVANYLSFKEARRHILEVKAANPGRDITPLLARAGGVNRWVWPVAIIVTLIGFIVAMVLGVVGCLAFLGSQGAF